ncbi:ribonuclease H family protein, partial [Methylobacterium nigriterrae]|uniref:ribonuclease H family protein n=1 Tax=Methylobacterium nigriterrae TaxID=3127512 RepID=UPI0030135171
AILINTRTGREKIVKGREAATTNNKMELSAAIAGLNALSPGAVVTMLGDSQYVIKGITEWLPGWKVKGWRGANKKPVANAELWQALEAAVSRHRSVTWRWVRGHNGHELNERVDRIASREAECAGSLERATT